MYIPWERRRRPYQGYDRPELAEPEPQSIKLTSSVTQVPNDLLHCEQSATDAAQLYGSLDAAVRVAYLATLRGSANRIDTAHYVGLLRSGRQSLGELCDEMRSSPEYRELDQRLQAQTNGIDRLGVTSIAERRGALPEGSGSDARKGKVAAFTMVYNESLNLPIWLRYYGSLLGRENLFVLDDGSDDRSTETLSCNRIRLPRCDKDEVRR
ncbi:MAG: hypothetical protein JO278_01335, partial [Dyella sp.]|nr:hypothetical protein [Dyella sp.]